MVIKQSFRHTDKEVSLVGVGVTDPFVVAGVAVIRLLSSLQGLPDGFLSACTSSIKVSK